MADFGEFETVGEPFAESHTRERSTAVWKARRREGKDGRVYAIKLLSPKASAEAGRQSEQELERDRGLEYLEVLKLQKKVQTDKKSGFLPVYEFGRTPEGAWYVTDFCPRGSLKTWVTMRGKVDSATLNNLVGSVAGACRAFKSGAGRSHGNLKTCNVLLGGKSQPLGRSALLLADPLPVPSRDISGLTTGDRHAVQGMVHDTFEVQDLHALGELMLQLVESRVVESSFDYNYPITRSPAWDRFGKDGEKWRTLCNQLLDPHLSLGTVSLESLAAQYQPSSGGGSPLILVGSVLGVAAVAGGVYFFAVAHKHGAAPAPPPLTETPKANPKPEPPPVARETPAVEKPPVPEPPPQPPPSQPAPNPQDAQYDTAMKAAQAASDTGDWAAAKAGCVAALQLRPDDADAKQLLGKAQQKLDGLENERKCRTAVADATQAFNAGDDDTALAKVDEALQLKSSDEEAKGLNQKIRDRVEYKKDLAAAKTASDRGDWAGAKTSCLSALRHRPEDVDAKRLLAEIQKQLGARENEKDFREALDEAAKAFSDGNDEVALTRVTAALQLKGSDPEALGLRLKINRELQFKKDLAAAKAASDKGDWAGAETHCVAALQLRPDDADAKQLLGEVQQKLQGVENDMKFQTAMADANQAFNSEDDGTALTKVSEALQLRGSDKEAQGLRKKITDRVEYKKDLAAAKTALDRGDWAGAKANSQAALRLRPEDAEAKRLLGAAQAKLDDLSKANQLQTVMADANKAFNAGDDDTALAQVGEALRLKNDDAGALSLRQKISDREKYKKDMAAAKAASDKGDWAGAKADYQAALLLQPEDAEAKQLLGAVQKQLDGLENDKKYQAAMADANQAFNAGDDDTALAKVDGALQLKGGDEEAKGLRKKITDRVEYKKDLAAAKTASGNGDWAGAKAAYQAALQLRPEDAEAKQGLGEVQKKLDDLDYANNFKSAQAALAAGNYDDALKLVAAALKGRPDDGDAKQLQSDATQKRDYAAAMAAAKQALAKMDSDTALDQVEKALKASPGDKGAEDLKKQSQLLRKDDNDLQDLMKTYGVKNSYGKTIDPNRSTKPAQTPEIAQRNEDTRLAEQLQNEYSSHGWLSDERKNCLKSLKNSIADTGGF